MAKSGGGLNAGEAVALGIFGAVLLNALAPGSNAPTVDHTFNLVLGELDRVCRVMRLDVWPGLSVGPGEPAFVADPRGFTVLCNRGWVEDLLQRYCRSAECRAAILVGILAHEVAHLSFQHVGLPPDDLASCSPNQLQELRADAVAGWVLARTGFPPDYLTVVLRELSAEPSCTHPTGGLRAQAIAAGFEQALEGGDWRELRNLRVVE